MINSLKPDFNDIPGRRDANFNYNRNIAPADSIDVSIITPYYNTEELFVETFVSLLQQSLQYWEWIIVDDGSTDAHSIDRLNKIVEKDNRIKLVRQNNAGPAAARNTAFKNSTGRYLCLLDSDDMLEPTYLEKTAWFLDSHLEYAFCNSYSVVFGDEEYLWTAGFERGKAYLKANSGPPISLIRRSAYSDCGGFNESIKFGHEDWDFWLAMAKSGHWGYTIPEYLQWYRKRGSGRFEQIMESDNANDDFEKYIQKKYRGLKKTFPEPDYRQLLPYEDIDETVSMANQLEKNTCGRRIMFLVPWMVTGGADRVNLDLIEGLKSKGHDVTLCATLVTEHNWEYQFSLFTSDIFILPNIIHETDYPRFLTYLIESRQIDTVVITASSIGYQVLPYLRTVTQKVAFIDMCHVEEPHWCNGGHPRFSVGYQDMLDLNLVTTKHLAGWMAEHGADPMRIKVMYTGIRTVSEDQHNDIKRIVRSEFDIQIDVPIIVFAGRICDQKRPLLLAEILKKIQGSGLVFQALIIGEGEQESQLKSLLSKYKLSANVKMLGSITHKKWLDILVASDVLLMPSQYEGISIALLEAMAAGVVPVVANVGGQEEIVKKNVGILISHNENELQEYSDGIQHLLENKINLTNMSNACKSLMASKLSWETMINNFLANIDEAHKLRKNCPRNAITSAFGKELYTQAMELKRVNDMLTWGEQRNTKLQPVIPNFVILISKTKIGQIMIKNKLLRNIGKIIFKRGKLK